MEITFLLGQASLWWLMIFMLAMVCVIFEIVIAWSALPRFS